MAFPSDVTMQTTTSAALAHVLITYYEKKGLERLLPRLRYAQFADKKPIPKKSGKTIQWYRFAIRAAVTTNLTEMTVPTRGNLSSVTITATLIQRGGYVALSDLVSMTAIDPIIEDAAAQMGEEAARSIDRYIRDIVTINVSHDVQAKSSVIHGAATYRTSGGGQRIWSGIATAGTTASFTPGFPMLHNKARILQSALVASLGASAITVQTVKHASTWLRSNNALPFDDGKYVGVIHSDLVYDLSQDPSWNQWQRYTTPEAMYRGEVGEIWGVRFVESTDAPKVAISGDGMTAALCGWLYGTLIVGKHAYGLTEIDGGFKVYVNEAGSAGAADPLHQINTVAWKATLAARVLHKCAGVVVLSTSTAAIGCG